MNDPRTQTEYGKHANPNEIAIIGIGCRYPGARTPKQLWENILARRRQFRRIPDVRLPLAEYQDFDKSVPDKTYGVKAAVIDGYEFNWAARRIPRSTFESTDIVHWLSLDVVLEMLEDAGYKPGDLPRETTQVVIGNTLTGEFTRSNTLRLRWPFVNKVLCSTASDLGMPGNAISALSSRMERSFKSVFAPINEDTLAGGLANTIAGRVCNYLNLNGGGYTVDGACSSSLIAVYSAAVSLATGAADFAIAGGVDVSLDPFELIGFAKTGALTPNEMLVYDKRGNGFIPGEGCGFVGMKRLADALRDGDKIYAVLDGWGMSSDGKGGITAPSVNGQSIALGRAYKLAGIDTSEIDFIEGHGTGTRVGDKTELLGITKALENGGGAGARRCGVTSFKSIVGHTKAAAGIGAFIKTVMAVNQRVIPPTAGCDIPHDVFSNESTCLYPVLRGEVHPRERQLRAGVSAMGFGGINLHVTLKSGAAPVAGLKPEAGERAALVSRQESEVYCLAAASYEGLKQLAGTIREDAAGASLAEMADMAASVNARVTPDLSVRASVVAGSPEELCRKMTLLIDRLATPPPCGEAAVDQENLIAISEKLERCSIGYLFPGQGSQRVNMARGLVERFEWARTLVAQAEEWAAEFGTERLAAFIYPDLDRHVTKDERQPLRSQLEQTQLSQPAIVLSSLLWLTYLERLGITPHAVMGHSLGELTAFYASGAFDGKALIQLAALRGRLMAGNHTGRAGTMVSLACDKRQAEDLIAGVFDRGVLVVANINSPSQTVVSGEIPAIEALSELAAQKGVTTHRLSVSNAFHSPLVARAAADIRKQAPIPVLPLALKTLLISSCDGKTVPKDIDLHEHFSSQILRPVDFVAAARSFRGTCDIAFEVGPGNVLSSLMAKFPDQGACKAYPVEQQAESFHDLNWLVGLAHAHGKTVRFGELYANRLIRPFVPARNLAFIVNPCERPFERAGRDGSLAETSALARSGADHPGLQIDGIDLKDYLSRRGSFISDVIRADVGAPPHQAVTTNGAKKAAPATARAVVSTGGVARQESGSGDAEQEIRSIAAAFTGFDAGTISMSLHLVDDLNLDSIKAGELIGQIAQKFNLQDHIDPAQFATGTLADLLPLIKQAPAPAATEGNANGAIRAAGHGDTNQLVLTLAAKATGFSADQINLNLRLLDDLNLDSIKADSLIVDACAQLGVAGQVDPAEFAGLTLGEIAGKLGAMVSPAAPAERPQAAADRTVVLPSAAPATGNDWVRSFEMRLVPSTLDPEQEAPAAFAGCVVAIQHEASEDELAASVSERMRALGATVFRVDPAELAQETRTDVRHFIVILPRRSGHAPLSAVIQRLRAAAVASARQAGCASLSYVQFGGISQGLDLAEGSLETACASSFAASVHLERPGLKVRVMDFHPSQDDKFVAGRIVAEQSGREQYVLSHYRVSHERYRMEPELLEPQLHLPRPVEWNRQDVVLVTGGAKGITAECALSFAKATGARMVLVGSSAYNDGRERESSEIGRVLSRYAEERLVASYCQCNLVDGDEVTRLIRDVEGEFGPITGVIHGAGMNKPRRVEQVSEEQALAEVSPKVLGFLNLGRALDERPPKLIAALSSIIGVTGMPGNSWYAFSNEALNLSLQSFRASHPGTHVVALAYSVWSEVGMGARLGSVKHLAKMGISAIAPTSGVAHFMDAVLKQSPANQVVIASRLGGLDTWRRRAGEAPAADRFIQDIQQFEPGVELVNRVRLTLDDDLYLRDHFYRGVYLFPTVFGLEAMGQCVAKVLGVRSFESLKVVDIVLQRPIVVGSDHGALIQITAEVMERRSPSDPPSVRAAISTEQSGFKRDHFAAVFVLEPQQAEVNAANWALPAECIDIDPKTELYGGSLFQGPLFQRLRRVWSMDSQGSLIEIDRHTEPGYFAPQHSPALILGDPSFRDVLLQSPQLSIKIVSLPVHIGALDIYRLDYTGAGLARNEITSRTGPVCDVTAVIPDGRPIERLQGYRLKEMDRHESAPEPEVFIHPGVRDAGLFDKALAESCARLEVSPPAHLLAFYPELSRMDRSRRRLNECPLFLDVVSKVLPAHQQRDLRAVEIQWADSGKPVIRGLDGEVNVSLSHDQRHCLCVAGGGEQGCDLEPIGRRSEEEWIGLMGKKRQPLLQELMAGGDSLNEAGTRIWCAMETATKALGAGTAALHVLRREQNSVLFSAEREGRCVNLLTFGVAMTRPPKKMAAMTVQTAAVQVAAPPAAGDPQNAVPPGEDGHPYIRRGPAGQPTVCFRFRATFKDTTTLRHGLNFPVFADWMGKVRELGTLSVAGNLVQDFASGRWGMVTNHTDIFVAGDAACMDLIEGRIHISKTYGKFNSSVDMHFDWFRINADGTEEMIASSNMATTWVEIKSHGVVEVQPFPAYMQGFINSNLPAGQPGPESINEPGRAAEQEAQRRAIAGRHGECLYQAPEGPKIEPELMSQTFSTTLAESNLVGNIYYSNYYQWMNRLVDRFFYDIAPELFTAEGMIGEFRCQRSEIRHLREAMPFDRIEVVMALKAVYSKGIQLHFDYYKLANGQRIKLAYGDYDAVWAGRGNGAEAGPIPDVYKSVLIDACQETARRWTEDHAAQRSQPLFAVDGRMGA